MILALSASGTWLFAGVGPTGAGVGPTAGVGLTAVVWRGLSWIPG